MITLFSRIADAWRMLWCRGEIVLFLEPETAGSGSVAASGDSLKAPVRREKRILLCSRGEACCGRCPRFQAFRKIPQKIRVDKLFFPAVDGNLIKADFKPAEVHDLHAPALSAMTVNPAAASDPQAHAVPPECVTGVDDPEHRAQDGDTQCNPPSGRHALQFNPATAAGQTQKSAFAQSLQRDKESCK